MHHDDTEDGPSSSSKYIPGTALPRGTSIAGRFTLEALVGQGGMGLVYQATDTRTQRRVALKLSRGLGSPDATYRFGREALLLSELHHPGIVAYVDHGAAEDGHSFLAMEWLEGEDLASRLRRQRLTPHEALLLVRRAAEALATAHRQGIVHRDLKPSNLFLREGRPEDVVLLDFGLARYARPDLLGVTRQGTLLGTPGYMAPEQASCKPQLTPSADIFSLGCVLHECLTGQSPFAAPHFSAALAKVLLSEPPRLHALCPEAPPGLQGLVDHMLEKEPARRLADADRLLEALQAIADVGALERPSGDAPPLVGLEQQVVSVLLVPRPDEAPRDETVPSPSSRDVLLSTLAAHGGRVEPLVDGSLVATLLSERGNVTDQVAAAARCALAFKERYPSAEVTLVTGLGIVGEHAPVGEVMDKAGRLLHEREQARAPEAAIVLDEVTAGLLGAGFLVSRSASGTWLLRGERLGADESRPLLGKPTPCVGRAQELALLEATLLTCAQEPSARAVLVVAPPGTGKSRLRHEFLRRLERKPPPALVLQGRGDPLGTGIASNPLGQALRRLCGLGETAPPEVHRALLLRRVALHLPPPEAREAAAFLGELCAVSFPDEVSARLRAARRDPRLMSAQLGKALVAFLTAECAQGPVVLVLDDLHWSDALSVKLVDEALRELAEQPLLVLALARPEVKERFPALWARRVLELSLPGLSAKAGAQLVREVLGERATDSVVRRVVEQSDGNALFLEELIRGEVEGRGETPPETVMAVLQARLTRVAPEVRRVLLAASFFGRDFEPRGLRALLGEGGEAGPLEAHLRLLVEQEILEPRTDHLLSTGSTYRFRHALMVDAAHALVPEAQRPPAHRRVAAWLEREGETDALVLARHFQLGQNLERASHFHLQAAEQLFARDDSQGATRCLEAALECGVGGEALTRLRALQALVALWQEQVPRALELGSGVFHELEAGGPLWCWLAGGLILAHASLGRHEAVAELSARLVRTPPRREALGAYAEALQQLGSIRFWNSESSEAHAVLERMREVSAPRMAEDGLVRGPRCWLEGQLALFFEARPWHAFTLITQGLHDFQDVGAERNAYTVRIVSGMCQCMLGDHAGAVETLKAALALGLRLGHHLSATHARHYLLQALASSPAPEHQREALALAQAWLDGEDSPASRQGMGYAIVAQTLALHGDLARAEPFAREACALLAPFSLFLIFFSAFRSRLRRLASRSSDI